MPEVKAKKEKSEKKSPTSKAKALTVETPILYPEFKARVYRDNKALTVGEAKKILGWEEVEDGKFQCKDFEDKKIRCVNNTGNRQMTDSWCRTLSQDILNRHWRLNGESIIVGKTGRVLSGQHRLVAFIRAEQERTSESRKYHWEAIWKDSPITLECLIVFGVDETPEITRTLDNVKPRTLADVLFSDGSVFGRKDSKERAELCAMTDYAIRLLWSRTKDVAEAAKAFDPHRFRTHSESLDFIDHHSKLLKAVLHIWEENQPQKSEKEGEPITPRPIGQFIGAGMAAAMMYLMAAGNSDLDTYLNADPKSEKSMKLDLWDKAEEFWTLLGAGTKEMAPIRQAMAQLYSEDGEAKPTSHEKIAVLLKAWNVFRTGGKITLADLCLEYEVNSDTGVKSLVDVESDCGGIDLGPLSQRESNREARRLETDREEKKVKLLANREKKKGKKAPTKGEDNGEATAEEQTPEPETEETNAADPSPEEMEAARDDE